MAQPHKSKRPAQPHPRSAAPPVVPWRRVLAGAGLIALMTSIAYVPGLHGEFIVDDDILLTGNRLIKAADGLYRIWFTSEPIDYWPVANTSFWFEWRLWGMQPTGYHITNLVLHLMAALLIWAVLERLKLPGTFLAALLFAVHPVNVETVAWIAQRKSLLAMVFFLLSILCYLHAERPPRSRGAPPRANSWYTLSLLAFVLAMLSKGSVATLPAVLLLILWWLRPLTRRDLFRLVPFAVAAIVLVRVNVWFQTHNAEAQIRSASFAERLLGAGGVIWFYLYKALLPVNLVFIYPQWHIHTDQVRWLLPLAATVLTTVVLWWYRRTWSRALLFAWAFFCVALVPVMGFTDVGFMEQSLVADRYQHVALIGVMALIAAGWSAWQRRNRWVATAVAVTFAGVLAMLTWQQSRLYAHATTLYQTTLQENPDSWLAHNNLGKALAASGRLSEATLHFEDALRLKPDHVEAHINLGNALRDTGRRHDAIEHYEQALRLNPGSPEAHNNLGTILFDNGQLQEAIEHYHQALRLNPDFGEAHYNLARAFAQAQQTQQAIEQYRQALRLNPASADAHYSLGIILAKAGQLSEAIEQFEQALRLRPDHPETHNNLGIALAKSGRVQDAIGHFQQALRLKPDFTEADKNLGIALAMQQKAPQTEP